MDELREAIRRAGLSTNLTGAEAVNQLAAEIERLTIQLDRTSIALTEARKELEDAEREVMALRGQAAPARR